MGKRVIKTATTLLILTSFLASCSGTRPTDIGISETITTGSSLETLKPCPETPNCVTSYLHNNDEGHYIERISHQKSKSEALAAVKDYVESKSHLVIVKEEGNYIHIEWTSKIMKFIDDLELYFLDDGIIHFRSAARIGRKDFDVNKSHIEELRVLLKN